MTTTSELLGRRPFGLNINYVGIASFALLLLVSLPMFWSGFVSLARAWATPEYSHGPLIPLISLYLFLRELRDKPAAAPGERVNRWPGVIVIGIGLLFALAGNLARIPDIITYGFILYIGALILILAGTREGFRFWPGWLRAPPSRSPSG